jgi:hypothetical protein
MVILCKTSLLASAHGRNWHKVAAPIRVRGGLLVAQAVEHGAAVDGLVVHQHAGQAVERGTVLFGHSDRAVFGFAESCPAPIPQR